MDEFTEPNMLNPQIMIQKNVPWIKGKLGDSPDETAFIRWRMCSIMRKIGFDNIKITPFGWLHPFVPEIIIPVISKLGGTGKRANYTRFCRISAYKIPEAIGLFLVVMSKLIELPFFDVEHLRDTLFHNEIIFNKMIPEIIISSTAYSCL